MSAALHIPARERGRLHVLAVNRPREEIARAFTPADSGTDRLRPGAALLADLTGRDDLDAAGAELIPLADLKGLGLSGYLTEGYDIAEASEAAGKRRLDALEGYALLLSSGAFGGREMVLADTADLTHIASFDLPGADWGAMAQPVPEAAKPYSAPRHSPRAERRRAQRLGGAIFAAFMVAIALVLWAVLT